MSAAMHEELRWLDATALAALVAAGEVSPSELVEAAIARVESLDGELGAVVERLFDRARAEARAPLPEGPFRGVPFVLKDLGAQLAGTRTTGGCRFTRHATASIDSTIVRRHRAAGLVTLGKTNTCEMGLVPTTEPLLFGPTKNPWDPTRTPGGSSGGAAAAVASGMVPMAHASDGGGSIRIPASCCGVFGLKPTRARTPLGPLAGDVLGGLVVEHAITRSVRDSAALLDATAGAAPGDPYCAPPLARPLREEVGADPGRLRVALSLRAIDGAAFDPACEAAAQRAAAKLEALGHHVELATPTLNPGVGDAFMAVWASSVSYGVQALTEAYGRAPAPDELEPLTWALAAKGAAVSAADYFLARDVLQTLGRRMAHFHETYDVWVGPTLAAPPLPLGSFDPTDADPLHGMRVALEWVPFTALCNVTGQPAMSVPLERTDDGLPIGIHVVAPFGDEATLVRLAAQLEAAHPWPTPG